MNTEAAMMNNAKMIIFFMQILGSDCMDFHIILSFLSYLEPCAAKQLRVIATHCCLINFAIVKFVEKQGVGLQEA